MSPFRTIIPIDLNATKELLPRKSYILGVVWNPEKSQLEMEWGHQELSHGLTIPVEFPLDLLKGQKLPVGVKRRGDVVVREVVIPAPSKPAPPQPAPLKCASCGKAIHWDGMSKYVHSDGKNYRHPCRPKKELLTAPDTEGEKATQR